MRLTLVKGEALIQVFLHQLDQREVVKALATEADPEAARRGIQTLAAEIPAVSASRSFWKAAGYK